MKKHLLILFISIIASAGIYAQEIVKMPDNTQYGAANSFQAKIASIIPSDYQAKTGDVITVDIAGTSDYDISNFQLVFVDTREAANYWTELTGWTALGDVTAGTEFEFSKSLTVTKDAAGAGGDFCNLALDGVSVSGIEASANELTLTLSTFEISIESQDEGTITLNDNGNGIFQGQFPDTLTTDQAVEIGDTVKVTIEGTSNVDISEFQTVVIDGTEAASYWKELSGYTLFGEDGIVTGETPFSFTTNVIITDIPTGTGSKSQVIVINGKASEAIKLSLDKFTAEIIKGGTSSVDNLYKSEIISTTAYSINGIKIGVIKSINELNNGSYILVNKYANGTIKTSKIIKRK